MNSGNKNVLRVTREQHQQVVDGMRACSARLAVYGISPASRWRIAMNVGRNIYTAISASPHSSK